MSNNREGGGGGSENRRRYFRRRPPGSKAQEPTAGPKESAPARRRNGEKVEQLERTDRNQRTARRRRRTRSKPDAAFNLKAEPVVAENVLDLGKYTPPISAFIYTHVSRPGGRDSYEFRSESFSKVGRRLEDYEIDLSQLYADDNRAEAVRAEDSDLGSAR